MTRTSGEPNQPKQEQEVVPMATFAVTATNVAIERLLEVTDNPRCRFLLQP
jgi:hypothetical protein